MSRDFSEKLESFLADNGFIWGPEPEIYGGLSGFYTYGPLGKLLKRNIEDIIRSNLEKEEFFEIEAPFIQPKKVWEASGHLETFVDPMISCNQCDSDFRADNLIEDKTGVQADSFTYEELEEFIENKEIQCPTCGSKKWGNVRDYNLMVKTEIGKDHEAYNRPETATTTYLPFNRLYNYFRTKTPIKVYQIGKAWRNEISPRKSVVRGREFTQAEAQILLTDKEEYEVNLEKFEGLKARFLPEIYQEEERDPEEMNYDELISQGFVENEGFAYSLFLAVKVFDELCIPKERMRIRQHQENERAHYASDAWDVEIYTETYGWIEACGIHDRNDYDLKRHSEHSGREQKIRDEEGEKVYPKVLEIAFGVDRPLYAILDTYYEEDDRKLFKVPRHLAPIKAGVFPLVKKDGLPELAREVFEKLKESGLRVVYDDSGSIGKRYRRIDEKGAPAGITIDYDSKEQKDVTIRDRDSMDQIRVPISELEDVLREFISGKDLDQLEGR